MTALRAFYMWWSQPQAIAILNSHATRLTNRGIDNTVESSADTRMAVTENELSLCLSLLSLTNDSLTCVSGSSCPFSLICIFPILLPPPSPILTPAAIRCWLMLLQGPTDSFSALNGPRPDNMAVLPRAYQYPVSSILGSALGSPGINISTCCHKHMQSQSPLLLSTAPPLGQVVTASMFRAALRELLLLAGLQHRGITPPQF